MAYIYFIVFQFSSDVLENLAWATAQIHCYRSLTQDEKNSADMSRLFTAETALNTANQGQGCVVMATDPKILFCDLRLSAGESKSCNYQIWRKSTITVTVTKYQYVETLVY